MKKNKPLEVIYFILVLAGLLRLVSLNQSLWLDEATTAQVVRNFSLQGIVDTFIKADFHPPLYYLVLKIWSTVFGTSEAALRLPSVIFGVGTVYLTFAIGKKLLNKSTGLIAALLLSVSPLHIYYSQEARMYSLSTFLVSLLVFTFLNAVQSRKVYWYLFSVVSALLIFTDYLPGVIFLVLGMYILMYERKLIKSFLLSFIPLVLAFAVYSPIFLTQLEGGLAVETSTSNWWQLLGLTSIKSVLLIPVKFLIGRITFVNKALYGIFVATFSLISVMAIIPSIKVKPARLPLLWLFCTVAICVVLGVFLPVLTYFRLLFCLPALYLLISIGLSKVSEKKFLPLFSGIVVLSIICSYLYLTQSRYQREDWRGFTEYVTTHSTGKSAQVVFVSNSQMEGYRYYNPPVEPVDGRKFEAGADTVWLMRYVQDVFDQADSVRSLVEASGYTKQEELNFNGIVVWKYERIVQ